MWSNDNLLHHLQDIKVILEDEQIIVVDKPAGVLCVPIKANYPSLSQAVFDAYGDESDRADKMVVHRLGMDTSGVVVFARTDAALRGMNTAFRNRNVTRSYNYEIWLDWWERNEWEKLSNK